nr:retrovirus-related Pol polyprotein from transposon TNT 1-94 [Tanacetum cinerariifolium]
MSAMANTTPLVTTVTKPATNPRDTDTTPRVNIQEFCEEYYEDILPIIMDKVRQDRRSNSASFDTRLRFVSRRCCVLPKKTSCVLLKDTQPPMLDRTDFASWQQWIRLYCRGKDNRVNILKSIDKGPYKLGTFRETLDESTKGTPQFGPERPHVYSDLNFEEQDRYNADIRATNILLQGLPKDIYTLINHYTDVKDIWDNVKMLLEGSELTKEDRESQLYDDFEHFRQHKEESINDYNVRFSKLINDIRNIKMTMPKLKLNSKFVNNMLPEWGRFVTAIKLNRGLREYAHVYAHV